MSTAKKLHEQAIQMFRGQQYEAALAKLNQALAAAESDVHRAAQIYNDMGVIHKQLKNYEAAYEALDEAMSRFTELGDEKGQAQTIGNCGTVLEAEGEIERAIEHYRHSAKMLEQIGEGEAAMYTWQAISRLRLKRKEYIAAIGAYEEGIENMPKNSFKRKMLEKIIKMPGKLIGGGQ